MAPIPTGVAPGCGSIVARDDRFYEGHQVSKHELEWRMLGACRGLDASVFYPESDDDAEIAKQVCRECGVRTACLEFALESREKVGVWGGATERERRRMLRQRRRTA
jgi:WhiB family redox-sensing transcriptional regulator